jgi:ethanolamine ammonia-lyase small subunit
MSNRGRWEKLRSYTSARIAIGRSGGSLTTDELLRFRKDHALAVDAVWAELNLSSVTLPLKSRDVPYMELYSQASDRQTYIKRPDLGRELDESSIDKLKKIPKDNYDLNITIADGLSAVAVERHAINFLNAFLPFTENLVLTPITVVRQGRVAISDQIGQLLQAKISIILIGERPGLSSPDSMGIYVTYNPQKGNTDEKRNCISNIRTEGLSYDFAAMKLNFLVTESLRRKLSGVHLKDTFDDQLIKYDRKQE